jgi:glycosyltransferase involved in cell wall biosynthesis
MITAVQVPPKGAAGRGGIDAFLEGIKRHLPNGEVRITDSFDPKSFPRPGIMHFHGLWQPSHLLTYRNARRLKIPMIISPHGMLEPWAFQYRWWKKLPYYLMFERARLQKASVILATSQMEASHLQSRFPGSLIRIIPPGLTSDNRPAYEESRKILAWKDEEFVLLFLSRIDRKKGLDLLLTAVQSITSPHKSLRLVIIGDGDPRYVNALRTAGNSSRVRIDWLGAIWGQARWKYLQGADLFCLPSHSENFGIAVMEALQAGTPVLTTNQTPWSQYGTVPGITIVQPSAEEISHHVQQFLNQSPWMNEDRERLAAWTFNQFGWETLASRYRALYQAFSA